MSVLNELYQELLLDYGQHPRHCGRIENADTYSVDNPLCGDVLTLYLKVKNKTIESIKFEGSGCIISIASVSLMSDALMGQPLDVAAQLFEQFHNMLTKECLEGQSKILDKLCVFANVRKFPMRVKCATLGWHALKHILSRYEEKH